MIILIILLCSLWAIVLTDYLEPFLKFKEKIGLGSIRKLKSDITLIDNLIYTVWYILHCPMCLSYHMFWIVYLILFNSFFGIILGVICYFLTYVIREHIMIVRL